MSAKHRDVGGCHLLLTERCDVVIENAPSQQPGGVARPLWLAICEAVVGRRRKATEGLVQIAAADLSAHRVEAGDRQAKPAVPGHQQPAQAEPHGAEIG